MCWVWRLGVGRGVWGVGWGVMGRRVCPLLHAFATNKPEVKHALL